MGAVKGWAWGLKRAKGSEMLILLLAEELADKNGEFSVSQAFIADKCNISVRKVRDTLKRLIQNGYLRSLKTGNNLTHESANYQINFSAEAPDETSSDLRTKSPEGLRTKSPPIYINNMQLFEAPDETSSAHEEITRINQEIKSYKKQELSRLGSLAFKTYCEEYKAKYGINPLSNPKYLGNMKSIIQAVGSLETTEAIIKHFFTMQENWYQVKKYSTAVLLDNLETVRLSLERGYEYKPESKFKRFETAEERNRRADMEAQERLIREEQRLLENQPEDEND